MTQLSLTESQPLLRPLARDTVGDSASRIHPTPGSLWSRLAEIAKRHGERTAFAHRDGTTWRSVSYAEVSDNARELASYLIERGIGDGDRVALLSGSRPEWCIGFFAALGTGGVVVPLDIKLSIDELIPIVGDAQPRVLLIADDLEATAAQLVAAHPGIEEVIVLGEIGHTYASYHTCEADRLHTMREHKGGDLAVLTYTSGTTGEPKGVMTTMGNLIHQVEAISSQIHITPDDRMVSILPLNHLLELTGGMLMPLVHGAKVAYVGSLFPTEILDAMKVHAITRMVVVPLFLKLVKKQIDRKLAGLGRGRRLAFRLIYALLALFPFRALKRRLFAEIHHQFGGALEHFVCGGAAIDVETLTFFDRIGLPILQGYGLTETSPVVTFCRPRANRLGSVGQALPGVDIAIVEEVAGSGEGEIITRGPNRMKGYYKRDDLTAEVIDADGWLHTGDRGRIDAEGFLYITGRIKNLIVLGSGKNVQPEEVEGRLENPLFDDLCIVGVAVEAGARGGCEEVCAVVVPGEAMRAAHPGDSLDDAVRDEVTRMARAIADYKRPTRIYTSRQPLPKTATAKVKRRAVAEWILSQEGAGS